VSRPNIVGLVWDDENRAHVARHRVWQQAVDDILVSGDWVEAHNKKRKSPRRRLIGRDLDGEMWTVIIERTSEPGFWRPVTGWQSSLSEMNLYDRLRIQHRA
jgi:hypothetical protein